MKLDKLLEGIDYDRSIQDEEVEICAVEFDSRKIENSSLFVAINGVAVNGHAYIDSAIEKGASVIVYQDELFELKEGVKYIKVADSNEALGIIASNYYGNPSTELMLVGVTGTNGKTTIATLLYDLMMNLSIKSGLLSTVCNRIVESIEPSTHTTPDALSINHFLRRMVDAGCQFCFMEVSSHAVDQKRIAGLHFKGGIFTNLTHDHLDYHKNFKNYLQAKQGFFTMLPKTSFAITNIDDKNGMIMVQNSKAKVVTYSCRTMADYHCMAIEKHLDGTLLMMDDTELWSRFTGDFNAYNLLAVYACSRELGVPKKNLLCALSELRPVAGRFDTIMSKDGVLAVVDYAHTPDALENVLSSICEVKAEGARVVTVVGCGGDRDKTKRPEMAASAVSLSDYVILTSDNPRSEEPMSIIEDMKMGISDFEKVSIEADREKAIELALSMVSQGDIVLIAGKGHENYQEIKGVKHHFDDKEIVKKIFKL